MKFPRLFFFLYYFTNIIIINLKAIDLDDFTGKFCCQGYYPLIRTVKSVLENDPKLMPPTNICGTCPTQEYKTLKKKVKKRSIRNKRGLEEVCKEKGEGVWADTTDCTKYFTCRSMSTAWAEKKHETCYTGSYFDQQGGQCKWVGVGNYNCDTILGKDKETEEKSSDAKPDKEDDSESSSAPGSLSLSNRQKIFYELTATNMKQISDTIMPADQWTCSAVDSVEYESNSDYIKCFSCDADSKNLKNCKSTPGESTSVVWCNSKLQKCYSKALYNTSKKEEIISFSRGCASLSDLENSHEVTVPTSSADSESEGTKTKCVQKANTTKSCFTLCNTHLCNVVTDIKSGAIS